MLLLVDMSRGLDEFGSSFLWRFTIFMIYIIQRIGGLNDLFKRFSDSS
jgi:hypothetical protein